MTISASNLTSGGVNNPTLITTSPIAPNPYALLTLWVASNASGGGPIPTIDAANGILWEQQGSTWSLGNYRWLLFRAMPAAPTSGPVTIRLPAQALVVYYWLDQLMGVVQTGNNGFGAFAQSRNASDLTNTLTSFTLPALAALAAGSASYAAYLPSGFGGVPTPRAGWTQVRGASGYESQYTLNGDTVSSLSWPTASMIAGVSAEILAAPNQTLTPTGIASGEAFGTPKLAITVAPAGIDEEAFGTAALQLAIAATAIASAEAFGTPQLAGSITPPAITSAEVFGTPSLAIAVAPAGFDEEAFGVATLQLAIAPVGIASAEAFGSPNVQWAISPTGFDEEAFGVPSLTGFVYAVGFDEEAFGEATIQLTIVPPENTDGGPHFPSEIGTPSVGWAISPPSIVDDVARGARDAGEDMGLASLGLAIDVPGIFSTEVFGRAVIINTGGEPAPRPRYPFWYPFSSRTPPTK